jgi:hypothetical protein
MKKNVIIILLIFCGSRLFSQNHEINLVVGLPKISEVQIEMIKNEFGQWPKIVKAEFVFTDHLLFIELDPDNQPFLKYHDVETILKKYFNESDIYKKDAESFKQLRSQYMKDDKIKIK